MIPVSPHPLDVIFVFSVLTRLFLILMKMHMTVEHTESSHKRVLKRSDSDCLLSRLSHMSRCKNLKKNLLSKNK